MFVNKLKLMGAALAAAAALTVGVSLAAGQFGRQVAQEPPQVPTIETKPASPQPPQGVFKGMRGMGMPRPVIQAIRGGDYIAVQSPDGRSISAISLKEPDVTKNDWAKYAIPAGLSAAPINCGSVMALDYSGDEIKEVAVFFFYNYGPYTEALWSKQTLREPAKGRLSPRASENTALYQVGSDLYAFSMLCRRWGLLHLERSEPPTIEFSSDSILVQQKETLYVYKPLTGQWTKGVSIKPVVTPPVMVAPPTPPPVSQKK